MEPYIRRKAELCERFKNMLRMQSVYILEVAKEKIKINLTCVRRNLKIDESVSGI